MVCLGLSYLGKLSPFPLPSLPPLILSHSHSPSVSPSLLTLCLSFPTPPLPPFSKPHLPVPPDRCALFIQSGSTWTLPVCSHLTITCLASSNSSW